MVVRAARSPGVGTDRTLPVRRAPLQGPAPWKAGKQANVRNGEFTARAQAKFGLGNHGVWPRGTDYI